jgi:hypothetical protein
MEAMTRRATMLRNLPQKRKGNIYDMVTILGSFDHHLFVIMFGEAISPSSILPVGNWEKIL